MNKKLLESLILPYNFIDIQLEEIDNKDNPTKYDTILKFYYNIFKPILRIPVNFIEYKYQTLLNMKITDEEFDIVLSNMDKYNCFISSDDAKYVLYLYDHSELAKISERLQEVFQDEGYQDESFCSINDALTGLIIMIAHHYYSHLNNEQLDDLYAKIHENMIYILSDSVKEIKRQRKHKPVAK